MRKKRVLIFHPTIAPYRIDLFNYFYKSYTTRICLSYENLRDQTFDYSEISSKFLFKPVYLKHFITFKGRYLCKGYWHQIKEFNPDIVIVSEFGLDAIAAIIYRVILRKTYKIISICDDSIDMLESENDFSKVHRLLRKIIVPHIDDLILVQPESKEWYFYHYGKGVFFPIVADDKRIRHVLLNCILPTSVGINNQSLLNKKIILYVGRLVKIKNISFLIENFISLNLTDSILVIVGDGNYANELRKLAKNNEKIIFTGRLEGKELFAWYNIANVFVLPSLLEPFGAVTNEALLGGCYGLISDKAGSACLIENGENGYTFAPENSDSFKKELLDLISKSSPIKFPVTLRMSRMPYSFDEYLNSLLGQLRENKSF